MNYTFHIKSFLQNIIDHIMIMKNVFIMFKFLNGYTLYINLKYFYD